jgi:hypothetical protein
MTRLGGRSGSDLGFGAPFSFVMRPTMRTSVFAFIAVSTVPISFAAQNKPEVGPFAEIDKHALAAPESVEKSIPELAKYLVQPCKTDKEKVRAFFRWITDKVSYDTEGFFSGKFGDTKATSVLASRVTVCDGYANLFVALCQQSRLEAVKVVGNARFNGLVIKSGNKILTGGPHAWNAVKINGQWRLLDVTWGAGGLRGNKFEKDFTEYYFLPSHDQLLFTHFPNNSRWQLVKNPISRKEFDALVKADHHLFRIGVTADQMKKELQKKSFDGFVQVGNFKSAKIIQAPINRKLKAGDSYTFRLESTEFPAIFAVAKDGTNKQAKQVGKIFEVTVAPEEGELYIVGGEVVFDLLAKVENVKYRSTILKYVVE